MVNISKVDSIKGSGLAGLKETAKQLIGLAGDYKVWLFNGQMGSGKTTLIKTICGEFGVVDNVASPTFSIINEYKANVVPYYHFDFYRVKTIDEAIQIGVEDYLYSGYYCFIEWPEIVVPILPDKYINIDIVEGSEEKREYKISYYDIN